jgi:hypothetical protein
MLFENENEISTKGTKSIRSDKHTRSWVKYPISVVSNFC